MSKVRLENPAQAKGISVVNLFDKFERKQLATKNKQ